MTRAKEYRVTLSATSVQALVKANAPLKELKLVDVRPTGRGSSFIYDGPQRPLERIQAIADLEGNGEGLYKHKLSKHERHQLRYAAMRIRHSLMNGGW